MEQTARHAALPQKLTLEELQAWLRMNAKVKFTDSFKRFFTPEEIREFEHESSKHGREANRLTDMLKDIRELIVKGNPDQDIVYTIPPTVGTKQLEEYRRQNDDFVEFGYETEEKEIFGVPYEADYTMLFFDIHGNEIPERARPLSFKERQDIYGLFDSAAKLVVDSEILQQKAI